MSDLALPVVAAVSWDADGRRIGMGFGADFDIGVAARRAVSEMISAWMVTESLAARVDGGGAPIDPRSAAAVRWLTTASVAGAPHLVPTAAVAARVRPSLTSTGRAKAIRELCARHSLNALSVDMARSDVAVAVQRVIVPGLVHFWPRFGGRRLFDVPVRMGWRRAPIAEAALNPQAMFL